MVFKIENKMEVSKKLSQWSNIPCVDISSVKIETKLPKLVHEIHNILHKIHNILHNQHDE